ncbi:Uncharacterized protein PCOAH_00019010 [Plasmodium coatneyi]|uniref:Plasmodium RESA N-terminal domain-containing protein n=1 Tax=Plasmodium coatneyi TaxID=208452 RepID=A0A1B1DXH0_9APIC|nr:Uncharacterized protein PCOAH_00019010 [Plasmodium coatneyi]ANQ07511.1 Uncharacterized protein PCOAH_00019010 [Plasmodium coatneyi]
MKNGNHNERNIKAIDKAKWDKSDENRTVEFATLSIIQWKSQIKVHAFLFILKIIILAFFLHILKHSSHSSSFAPGNNLDNARHNVRFKTLRLLNENGCTNYPTINYKSVLLITKEKSGKSHYSGQKTETTKSSIISYKDLDDEMSEVDLSDEGVLLEEMNKIILQERLMREKFSKSRRNSPSNEYFTLYFNDENCIHRIMDLSRKSSLYSSKLLRLKYRVLRHIKRFINRMKIFFIMEYRYNRNLLEEFRASNFYYFLVPYVKSHIKIFFSRFSKQNPPTKSKY